MAIVRWEPLRELSTLQNEMNRLFGTVFDTPAANGGTLRRWMPAMDLVETDEHFVLRADLPGLAEEDVNIEVEDRVLTVSGERKAEHDGEQGGLPPRRARVRLLLALADAARGRRRRGRHRQLRPRRARGPDPEARAAQAAQDLDRRRRRAEDRSTRRRRRAGAALTCRPRVPHPHQGPGLLRPHRHAEARARRGPHARLRPRSRRRPSSRRSRCARPASSASTWCWGTRSTCSSRPATS